MSTPGGPHDPGSPVEGASLQGEALPTDTRAHMSHEDEVGDKSYLRKVVGASMAGTVVEWYEFFLYATAATIVFPQVFFPDNDDPLTNVIIAFATYAVGFVARPLGGIVFGHFGDKLGRKSLLQLSLLLIGLSTFLMGCLPGYDTVGYFGLVALALLRFVQGFALGGEWGGAVLLVCEHCPNKSRGFWGSWPQAGVPLGNLMATLVLLLLNSTLSEEAFLSWGWRVAFWLSVVIVAIGYYIRTQVSDSPTFTAAREQAEQDSKAGYGMIEVFRRYPRGVFTAMGLRFAENIVYYIIVTFTITYLNFREVDTTLILTLMLIGHAIHAVIVPIIGAATDRFGRRPVYAVGAVLTGIWPFVAFPMYNTEAPATIILAVCLGLLCHGLMYAGQPALMAEMFPTRMRYSGVSLGYQVTAIVAGSLAPIIATAILRATGDWFWIAVYIAGAAAVTLVAVYFLRETKGTSLVALDKADMEKLAAEAAGRR